MKEIDFPFSSYVTPRDGLYNISEECRVAGDEYLLQLGRRVLSIFRASPYFWA